MPQSALRAAGVPGGLAGHRTSARSMMAGSLGRSSYGQLHFSARCKNAATGDFAPVRTAGRSTSERAAGSRRPRGPAGHLASACCSCRLHVELGQSTTVRLFGVMTLHDTAPPVPVLGKPCAALCAQRSVMGTFSVGGWGLWPSTRFSCNATSCGSSCSSCWLACPLPLLGTTSCSLHCDGSAGHQCDVRDVPRRAALPAVCAGSHVH